MNLFRRAAVMAALTCVLAAPRPASAAKYNNTVFGYSVDYPSWWTIDSKTLSDGVRFLMPGTDQIWMQIRVTENPEGQSLDDLLVSLLKTLSGAPEGLAAEPGLPTPAPAAPPGGVAGGAAPDVAAAAAGLEKPEKPKEKASEEQKAPPSIAVGVPAVAAPPAPDTAPATTAGATASAPPRIVDPTKPIPGPVVRWITLDGAEAWYAEFEGQWILKCLKDGFVYELSANSRTGTMYEWYFGPFFNSFKFQQRLAK